MAFVPNTLSNLPVTSGQVFFVDSTASRAADGNAGRDPDVPLATLDAAVARCTASRGDMIVIKPGHAETVTATDVTLDIAGVQVIGLGRGDNRPTFTMSATGSTFTISAAGVRLSNVIIQPTAVVVSGVTISSAGTGCEVDNCTFKEHATAEFTAMITVGTAAYVTIRDNKLYGLNGTAGAIGISLNGCDNLTVTRNVIMGDFSTGCIENITDECLSVYIGHNSIRNMSTSGLITMDANATGMIEYNAMSFDGSGFAQFVPGNARTLENYISNDDDQSGVIVPAATST